MCQGKRTKNEARNLSILFIRIGPFHIPETNTVFYVNYISINKELGHFFTYSNGESQGRSFGKTVTNLSIKTFFFWWTCQYGVVPLHIF